MGSDAIDLVQPLRSLDIDGDALQFSGAALVTDVDSRLWQVLVTGATQEQVLQALSEHQLSMTTLSGARMGGRVIVNPHPLGRAQRLVGIGALFRAEKWRCSCRGR
jgi:hypothetical protein